MKKYVIYSANIGNYDNIFQPKVIHDEFDYILFSDTIKEEKIGVWQIRKVDYHHPDKTRIGRWVKTHPELLVNDYNISVWIDSNIQIQQMDFYLRAIELLNTEEIISSMWHNERDCIYDEAAAVTYDGLDSERTILDWEHKLIKEKYPTHNGLFESNVIYRNHHHGKIIEFDKLWWNCIEHYSRRDQLSFCYALWKLDINCPYYLPFGENTRNSKFVKWNNHQNQKSRVLITLPSDNQIVHYYKSLYQEKKKLSDIYKRISPYHSRHLLAVVIGQFFRLKIHLRLFLQNK